MLAGKIEDFEKLEIELEKKRKEMEDIFKETQVKYPGVLESIKNSDIKEKLEAIKEMQKEILQKKDKLKKAPKNIQIEMRSFKDLRANAQKEDIKLARIAFTARVEEKKQALENAIKEMDNLRIKYMKKFHSQNKKEVENMPSVKEYSKRMEAGLKEMEAGVEEKVKKMEKAAKEMTAGVKEKEKAMETAAKEMTAGVENLKQQQEKFNKKYWG